MFEAVFRMLHGEAIRLVSQPEQSHERFTREDLAAASSHDRRHAAAQIGDQDARRLHSCRAAFRRMVRPLARHRQCGRFAPLPTSPRRSRHLTGHTERHDHRSEVLLRSNTQSPGSDGEDAPGAGGPNTARHSDSRGGGPPDRVGSNPQAPHGPVGGLWRGASRQRSGGAKGR